MQTIYKETEGRVQIRSSYLPPKQRLTSYPDVRGCQALHTPRNVERLTHTRSENFAAMSMKIHVFWG